jgi:hypothetical protein
MMPIMSSAMQTLRRASIARASTTLNIIQQVGASIGTAVLVVILTAAISARIPGATGLGGAAPPADTPASVLADLNEKVAAAFGEAFWWALGLVVIAFFVALVLLPKNRPEPVDEEEDDLPTAVLMH